MANRKNSPILLIAFQFPPYIGVGAHRWARFAKHLADMGHTIHVVTAKWPADNNGLSLYNQVIHERIKIHTIPSGSMHRVKSKKSGNMLFDSLRAKAVQKVSSVFWYDDDAQHWGRFLLPNCEKVILENNIKVVIATGGPFQTNRWAAELRNKNRDLKLIQDFRDPWSENPFRKYLFDLHRRNIDKWEQRAIDLADYCVFVTEGLKDVMLRGVVKESSVISNGHDIDGSFLKPEGKRDQIIHIGTLANGRDSVAEPLFRLCEEDPKILQGNTVLMYGRISNWLYRKYRTLFTSGLFILKPFAAHMEVLKEVSSSKLALQFNAKEYPYLVSTKIFEYAALEIPTLSINGGGEIEKLIQKHDIGISVRPEASAVKTALDQCLNNSREYNYKEFSRQYSYSTLARTYSSLINELHDA